MYNVSKKSKIATIIIIIFAILVSIIANSNLSDGVKKYQRSLQNEIIKCSNNDINVDDYEEYCQKILKNNNVKVDTLTSFSNILIFQVKFLNPIAILLVLIPSLIEPIYILKNKFLINSNNRIEYKYFLKLLLKRAYKYIWILPLIGVILYVPTMFYSSLNPEYQVINGFTFWETNLIQKPLIFMILYSLNLLMYSIIFVNIGLISIKKSQKYIASLIYTYIVYILIKLFFELVINNYFLISIFHSEIGYLFNIMNMFIFSDQFGLLYLLLFSFVILVISFICLYFSYKDKEKLVISIEKNY